MGPPCDWQVSKQKVAERGRYLLETGQWSDCQFVVGQDSHQQILEGHKLFLAMSSPVFEAMFYGSMSEETDIIQIPDVQPEAFKILLEYIYTDQVDLTSFELACELCYCAKKYMLPYLVEECTKFLWSDLTPNKACRAYEFAKLFEEPVFMEKCLQIISIKTNEVLNDPSWEEVELGTISTLFDSDKLDIDSEIVLFSALEKWAKAECNRKSLNPSDPKCLRSVIGDVLSKIRFLTLKPQQFAECSSKSLLSVDEAYAILSNISSNCSNVPMPEGFSTNLQHRMKLLEKQEQLKFNPLSLTPSDISMKPTPAYSSFGSSASSIFGGTFNTSSFHGPTLSSFGTGFGTLEASMQSQASRIGPISSRVYIEGGFRDGTKFYCTRPINQLYTCFNSGLLDCSVTFSVDKDITITGIQVPTQTLNGIVPQVKADSKYTEVLYVHLLDSGGTRLSFIHFTSKVALDSLVEVGFNTPIRIFKDKIYRVGVVFNKPGTYPIGDCIQRITCNSVTFAFGVGEPADTLRGGLIRSIVFH